MVKYNITEYPDGQINIKMLSEQPFDGNLSFRINSYKDLFILKSIADCYTANNKKLPNLFIPCLFGQQSDRRFSDNESFDLKVITDFINSCKFPSVTVFDPHSDVSIALLKRGHKLGPDSVIKSILIHKEKNSVLISPDAGAYKKVFKIASENDRELIPANKFRDREGNISISINGQVDGLNCLIIDDLCENGGTFIALSKKLKELGAKKVSLYVSHFKGGKDYNLTIKNLKNYLDIIYTTNSVRDYKNSNSFISYEIFK